MINEIYVWYYYLAKIRNSSCYIYLYTKLFSLNCIRNIRNAMACIKPAKNKKTQSNTKVVKHVSFSTKSCFSKWRCGCQGSTFYGSCSITYQRFHIFSTTSMAYSRSQTAVNLHTWNASRGSSHKHTYQVTSPLPLYGVHMHFKIHFYNEYTVYTLSHCSGYYTVYAVYMKTPGEKCGGLNFYQLKGAK